MVGKPIDEIVQSRGTEILGRIVSFHPVEMDIAIVDQIDLSEGNTPSLITHITDTSKCGTDPKKSLPRFLQSAYLKEGDWLSLTILGTKRDTDGVERSYAVGEYRVDLPEVTDPLERLYAKLTG